MKLFGGWFEVLTVYGTDGEYDTPYMTRIVFGRLRFHIFHRGDLDPDHHDHAWSFWTFPLTSYVEEVLFKSVRPLLPDLDRVATRRVLVKAFRWHHRPATYAHRVLGRWNGETYNFGKESSAVPGARPGRIVTICWQGRPEREWGFWKQRDGKTCWQHWKQYIFEGGKSAPCQDSK